MRILRPSSHPPLQPTGEPCPNTNSPRWLTLLSAASLLLLTLPALQSATLTATLRPEAVAVTDTAQLELRFVDGAPASLPAIPSVPGLSIQYASQGTETRMVNTSVYSALVLYYRVRASQPGTYTIPSIRATVGGNQLATSPIQLTVTQADPQVSQLAFLTLAFPKERFFLGETTTAEIHLYARGGGRIVQLPSLAGDGAVFGTNVPAGPTQQVTTNNAVHSRLIWQVPVTFAKTGTLRFTAQDAQLQVQFDRRPSRDPFAGLGGFFSSVETRTLNLSSSPELISVTPLPTNGVPADFQGAVGRFQMSASVSATNLTAGDPVTLTVRLSGLGNLMSARWSAPPTWPNFRTYDPTVTTQSEDPLGITGTRIFEQVLIPESDQISAIPLIHFSFFDPVREVYDTVSHPGFPLKVQPGTRPNAQPLVLAAETADPGAPPVDIVHIKSRLTPITALSTPLPAQPWFLALQCLPVLAWLAALTWRRRQTRLAANPREARRRKVARRQREGLQLLRQHAQAANASSFYSELFRLLQEQLGERLDQPAGAITASVVENTLRHPNGDHALADAVEALFARCDQARYANAPDERELESLLPRIEATLRQLHELEARS